MSDGLQMAPEEFRALIVDYLYESLDEADRARFEGTMNASPELRGEVDALARTLRVSRRALRAAEEPAPARVRESVLEAAAAKARAMAEATHEVGSPSASQELVSLSADVKSDPEGGGQQVGGRRSVGEREPGPLAAFWAFLRQPWALSAVTAAAVITLFFLTKDVVEEVGQAPSASKAVSEAEALRREEARPPAAEPAGATEAEEVAEDVAEAEADGEGALQESQAETEDMAPSEKRLDRKAPEAPARASGARRRKARRSKGFAPPPKGWSGSRRARRRLPRTCR